MLLKSLVLELSYMTPDLPVTCHHIERISPTTRTHQRAHSKRRITNLSTLLVVVIWLLRYRTEWRSLGCSCTMSCMHQRSATPSYLLENSTSPGIKYSLVVGRCNLPV